MESNFQTELPTIEMWNFSHRLLTADADENHPTLSFGGSWFVVCKMKLSHTFMKFLQKNVKQALIKKTEDSKNTSNCVAIGAQTRIFLNEKKLSRVSHGYCLN